MDNYRMLFGIEFKVKNIKIDDLPIYITVRRSFFKMSYYNIEFILVKINTDEKFGVVAYSKQAELLSEKYGIPVAFEFENIGRTQRNSLIDKNIPFISESGQLYLPFLGMALNNEFKKSKKIKVEKMMPATQELFLYMVYKAKEKPVLKKDAADYLGITRTSITRASEQLLAMNLISQEKHGKEYHMISNGTGISLFYKARPYLINPIQRVIRTKRKSEYEKWPLSGEAALAACSMLNEPMISAYAISKSVINAEQISESDIRWEPDSKIIDIELWKYDPVKFAQNGIVDPVSLTMCFENNTDERIEESIIEYLEGYQW